MPFNEQLPEWEALGTEPPESKKQSGWAPSDKPPADYFNWLFNRTYLALKELREKAVEKSSDGKIVADRVVDGAATDSAIGDRTIDQTKAPKNTGRLSDLLGGIANMIKAITGKSDWKTGPRTTLENAVKRDGDTITGDTKLSAGFNYQVAITKSGKDANGKFSTVEIKRPDGTLFLKSILSNPDANGNYQTDTWTYYLTNGSTVAETKVWTLAYDADGDVTNVV